MRFNDLHFGAQIVYRPLFSGAAAVLDLLAAPNFLLASDLIYPIWVHFQGFHDFLNFCPVSAGSRTATTGLRRFNDFWIWAQIVYRPLFSGAVAVLDLLAAPLGSKLSAQSTWDPRFSRVAT